MMTRAHKVGLLLLTCCLYNVASENRSISIDCNGPTSPSNTEVYGQFETLEALSNLNITCVRLRVETTFIIFQVHAYLYNVTLYQDKIAANSSFFGTNLGLLNLRKELKPFHITNMNSVAVNLYISVHGYNASDPIPGGCNLVDSVKINPTLDVSYTDSVIKVVAAPAQIRESEECGSERKNQELQLNHTFYRLYLTERDYSEQEYFDGIRNMLTLDKILKLSTEIPARFQQLSSEQLKRQFSLYPGTGIVFVTVVTTFDGQAVYVPSLTYGCILSDGEDTCDVFSDVLSQVTCALMFFAGLFICFLGHRFFKTEMFLLGVLAGTLLTYAVMSHTALEPTAMLWAALLSGVFTGAIWLLFWWFYGVPLFSVALATLLLGLLTASFAMFLVPDDNTAMAVDGTFWTVFWIVAASVPILLLCVTLQANLLCCAILGAYATVYSIDHYIESNLKYVVINIIRRAVVPGFQNANVAVPYQWRDSVSSLLFMALAITGLLFQTRQARGRVPFPPPPRDALRAPAPPPRAAPAAGGQRRSGPVVWAAGPAAAGGERKPLLA